MPNNWVVGPRSRNLKCVASWAMKLSRADSDFDASIISLTNTGIIILMSLVLYMYNEVSEYVLLKFSFVKTLWSRLFHCRPPCLEPYNNLFRRQMILVRSPWTNPSGCSM